MSAPTNAVQSAAMARREPEPAEGTVAINLRLPARVKRLLEEYRRRWPLRPTMTTIIVTALEEWFARNPLPPDKDAGSGPGPRRQR
jgi:hypothetical protein